MARVVTGKDFMSIQSAATETGCEENEIWSRAVDGDLKLSITIPAGYAVWSMARIQLEPWRYGTDYFDEGTMDRMPEQAQSVVLLNLPEGDCGDLKAGRTVEQGTFFSGYKLGIMEELDYVSLESDSRASTGWSMLARMFVLYKVENPPGPRGTSLAKIKRVNVHAEDVVVSGEELAKLREYVGSGRSRIPDRLEEHSLTSKKMVYLNQVAKEMWATALKNREYPNLSSVITAINRKFRLHDVEMPGKNKLERAASIIHPGRSRSGEPYKIELTEESYMTDELKLMVEASDAKWRNADLNDSATYPAQDDVRAWLKERVGEDKYSKNLADAIGFLIRPEGATKGRRTKSE